MESNIDQVASTMPPRKWYNHEQFPLIPQLRTRPADDYNTWHFGFDWLFFRIWNMDSVGVEVAVVCDGHWGIGMTITVPYLRIVACIPMPYKWQSWVQQYLWRRPKTLRK